LTAFRMVDVSRTASWARCFEVQGVRQIGGKREDEGAISFLEPIIALDA
jgi:hypothetical protein